MFDSNVFLAPSPSAECHGLRGGGANSEFRFVRWGVSRHGAPRPRAPAKKAGLAFERKVLDVLGAIYENAFASQVAIQYILKGRPQLAILDGLLTLPGPDGPVTIIIEVKLSHTERVWDQLIGRYLPLVRALEPTVPLRTVEICRTFDPAVQLPGPHTRIDSLHARNVRAGPVLEVLQWRI